MKYPVSCQTCGDVVAELTDDRTQAACDCGASIAVDAFSLGPGCVFAGGYRITSPMPDPDEGFVAHQEGVDRQVQIKVLAVDEADDEGLARFQRQVKVSASLQHSGIITAYHAGQDCGILYLAVQYVDGESLARRLDRTGPLPQREALKLLLPIAEAMNYAWCEHQIIHRNLKPANVIVADDVPMLADLAIAKTAAAEASVTGIGFAVGTPEYMSPEQARGEESLDCRSDVYAFGIMLYELLTGRPPFTDTSPILVLHRQLDEEPTPPRVKNDKISAACSEFVISLLQKDRDQRPPDWQAVIAGMQKLLAPKSKKAAQKSARGKTGSGRKTSVKAPRKRARAAAPPPPPPESGSNNWLYVAIAGGILIVLLFIIFR